MSDNTVIQVTPDGEEILIHEKDSADLWLNEPLGGALPCTSPARARCSRST